MKNNTISKGQATRPAIKPLTQVQRATTPDQDGSDTRYVVSSGFMAAIKKHVRPANG